MAVVVVGDEAKQRDLARRRSQQHTTTATIARKREREGEGERVGVRTISALVVDRD